MGTQLPSTTIKGSWVQTERAAHEAFAKLTKTNPSAATLMHTLIANMSNENALVVSQATLATLCDFSIDTVKRSLKVLEAQKWIQIIRIGKGKESVYVVNDRVAWASKRGDLRFSRFSATVIASASEQDSQSLESSPLKRMPKIFPGDVQLPHGPGEDPPAQPFIEGLEPDLPTRDQRQALASDLAEQLAAIQAQLDGLRKGSIWYPDGIDHSTDEGDAE